MHCQIVTAYDYHHLRDDSDTKTNIACICYMKNPCRLSSAGAEERGPGRAGLPARRTRREQTICIVWSGWAGGVRASRVSKQVSHLGLLTPGSGAGDRTGVPQLNEEYVRSRTTKTDRRRFRLGPQRLTAVPSGRFGRRLGSRRILGVQRDWRLPVWLVLMWLLMACGMSAAVGGGPFVCCAASFLG